MFLNYLDEDELLLLVTWKLKGINLDHIQLLHKHLLGNLLFLDRLNRYYGIPAKLKISEEWTKTKSKIYLVECKGTSDKTTTTLTRKPVEELVEKINKNISQQHFPMKGVGTNYRKFYSSLSRALDIICDESFDSQAINYFLAEYIHNFQCSNLASPKANFYSVSKHFPLFYKRIDALVKNYGPKNLFFLWSIFFKNIINISLLSFS
ncbi:hypothetical protein DID80_04910 [Candidatus Marinamargulisbacteria bacterium SCGC AAA071-K20]|nr:hypothetical protein DID80_04910 [Candidatus Marinamargulisbacteria bacterium SCGC AAA071-K20]